MLSILFILPLSVGASVSDGTVEAGNKTVLVCHSVDCVTPTPGVVNFAPTGTTPVTVSDTNGIDGVAWGNEIGWINFDPTGSEGLTINSTTGLISGWAWSQVAGWINFSATGQSVTINTDGEFVGYAWTGGLYGGWIKFDCSFAGACLKTDWRPLSARPSTAPVNPPAPGGSTPQNEIPNLKTSDMCLNISGIQQTIPSNYAKDEGGLCVLSIDFCTNILGTQLTVPNTHVLNDVGQCVVLTDENEDEFILEEDKDVENNSTTSISLGNFDYCQNLFGLQSQTPEGFVQENGVCLPKDADYCLNLLGNQYSVPENMKVASNGECVKMTASEVEINNIFKESIAKLDKNRRGKVMGYSFIPDFLQTSFTVPFLSDLFNMPVEIDLISLLITIPILGLCIYFIRRKLQNLRRRHQQSHR